MALLGGCAKPSWMKLPDMPDMPDMPTITLPSFGSDGEKPVPARVTNVEVANSSDVTEFYGYATEFYRRLEGRRFNSVAAFRDAGLREYFENDQAFTDYYADLADELAEANFERSVPVHTTVEEFAVDGPGRARVKVLIVGADGRPLRFWSASVAREDRWERRDGRWWIKPGRS